MNVGDIKRRVVRRFGDASNIMITSADIYDWVNDGMFEICRQTACLTTPVTGAASTYSADGVALPANFIRTIRVTYTMGGEVIPLQFSSIDELDNIGVSGNQIKDVPRLYYHSESKLYLYPAPTATDANVVRHLYARNPTLVTSDVDVPGIPEMFHPDLVTFCLMRGYERDQNYRAMNAMQQEFLSGEANRKDDAIVQDDTYLAVQDYDWYGW